MGLCGKDSARSTLNADTLSLDQVAPEAHMLAWRDIAAKRDPESNAELQDMFHSFPYGVVMRILG
ncbi:hypothetical protein CPB85DRAFT_1441084 [Mucidula mucida]|nr:hypothetical protein CPB85DRAFT_1441084 [Mucidula mucida]